jgi:hypothetical protein
MTFLPSSTTWLLFGINQAGAESRPKEDTAMHNGTVAYPGKIGAIRASLAWPEGDEKLPGVIAVHESRGLSAYS